MNLEELRQHLANRSIRDDAVAFCPENHGQDEQYCINRNSDGSWEVYYRERGTKGGLARFSKEAEACNHLLALLEMDDSAWSRDGV